jgi:hypothetical protein
MVNKASSRALTPAAFAGVQIAAAVVLGFAGPASAQKAPPTTVGGGDPPSICNAITGNLVTNCGFETGSFSGWTVTAAAQGSNLIVALGTSFVNSGTFGAGFGATMPPFEDMISQSIPTVAGQAYDISFFLENFDVGPNQFTAMFDGTTLLSLTNSGPFGYTEFTDIVTATSSSTTLSFAAYQVPSFFGLDDISVVPAATPVPEPASFALLGGAMLVFGVVCRRRGGV